MRCCGDAAATAVVAVEGGRIRPKVVGTGGEGSLRMEEEGQALQATGGAAGASRLLHAGRQALYRSRRRNARRFRYAVREGTCKLDRLLAVASPRSSTRPPKAKEVEGKQAAQSTFGRRTQ